LRNLYESINRNFTLFLPLLEWCKRALRASHLFNFILFAEKAIE